MCTVTYIQTGSDGEFVFTSNRDEAPNRKASELIKETRYGKQLLYPQDAGAHGSWIIISDSDQLVCILNGAFVRHDRQPPYRMSRGVMAREFFSYENANDFFEHFDFEGLEPFTMVIYDRGDLYECRWDEKKLHPKSLSPQDSHLWASATLYNEELQQKRRDWFSDWEARHDEVTVETVLDYHKNGGEGNPQSDVVMNYKDIVCTTSITSIHHSTSDMSMRYENLISEDVLRDNITLKSEVPHEQ